MLIKIKENAEKTPKVFAFLCLACYTIWALLGKYKKTRSQCGQQK